MNGLFEILAHSLQQMRFKGGGTSFSGALSSVDKILVANDHDQYLPVLLFLSDGECQDGDLEIIQLASNYGPHRLQVFVVGFGVGQKERERLQQLASHGNGKYLESADNLKELLQVFEKISEDISALINIK